MACPLSDQHRKFVLADPGREIVAREGRGEARSQGGQDPIHPLMAQRLVQTSQAIHVGDHQLVVTRLDQRLADAREEGGPVQQAGKGVAI